ncbi:shieldin complex subunit 3 isoform X1 [Brachionichthys hirsutus]|uniref:shieldin complex subunit 3 isoform X1 n=1 Tax=Brachionichthys hirsutus TaxID=412623 RepID=UPI00360507E7
MEDVVLHYQPGSDPGLRCLLETTEKLLRSFPCRTPPVFSPWFPAAADHHRPIRPAKAAPIITVSEDGPHRDTVQRKAQKPAGDGHGAERSQECPGAEATGRPLEKPSNDFCVSETLKGLWEDGDRLTIKRDVLKCSPGRQKKDLLSTGSPGKRSWSVLARKRPLLQSSQSLSEPFHQMVSVHRLHPRQRARWAISRHNCGAAGDIEQVWQAVSRSVQTSSLPTCNAYIQRERAEVWVFCDVVHSEQVGRFLKDELRLSGRISLSVPRLGNVFSM